MIVIENLFSLFFSVVLNVVNSAPYLCYLVIAGFTSALIFNIIHVMLGGD